MSTRVANPKREREWGGRGAYDRDARAGGEDNCFPQGITDSLLFLSGSAHSTEILVVHTYCTNECSARARPQAENNSVW